MNSTQILKHPLLVDADIPSLEITCFPLFTTNSGVRTKKFARPWSKCCVYYTYINKYITMCFSGLLTHAIAEIPRRASNNEKVINSLGLGVRFADPAGWRRSSPVFAEYPCCNLKLNTTFPAE